MNDTALANWMQRHAVQPADLIAIVYLIWGALTLYSSPSLRNPASPIHRHLTDFWPLWVWETALLGCALLAVSGLLLCRPQAARVAYLSGGALWLLLIWVLWQTTHSRLLVVPYLSVAIVTLWRSGQLAPRASRRRTR